MVKGICLVTVLSAVLILSACSQPSTVPTSNSSSMDDAAQPGETAADAGGVDCRNYLEEFLEPVDSADVEWPTPAGGIATDIPPTCVGSSGSGPADNENLKAIWLGLTAEQVESLFTAGQEEARAAGFTPAGPDDEAAPSGDNGASDWWGPIPEDPAMIAAQITLVHSPDSFTLQYVPAQTQ